MKNLKKVVALSLAAVMMFGMMVVGAGAAAYKDAADIEANAAVGVMSAIQAIEGDPEGNYNPNNTLCRADAAVIAARVALTRGNANKLGAVATSYTDIPANFNYATGAIAWATNEGILAGDGTGKFNPGDDLSGFAFAKMLLVVLGYDAEVQGYVNTPDWDVNINFDAMMAGLLDGLKDVDLSGPITREQAAIMAFNAVTAASLVEYDSELTAVNGVLGTKNVLKKLNTTLAVTTYALNYVPADYDTDSVVGGYWTIGGEKIESTVETVEASIVIKGAQKLDDLKKQLKDYTFDTSVAADVDALQKLTGNGVTIELYVDAEKAICDIVVSYEKYATVTSVTTDRNDKVTKIVTNLGTYTPAKENEPAGLCEALVELGVEKDDVLVATYVDGAVKSYAVAESAEGKVTKKTDAGFTAGGVEYTAAAKAETYTVALGKEYTIYLDSNNYVLNVVEKKGETPVEETPDYLYVLTAGYEMVRGEKTYYFTGVTMDGTKVEANYVAAKDKDGNELLTAFDIVANDFKDVNKLVEYSEEDGVYALADADLTPVTDAIEKGAEEFGDAYFGKDVKFLFLYAENAKKDVVLNPTFVNGVPAVEAGTNYYVFTSEDDQKATRVDLVVVIDKVAAPVELPPAPPAEYVEGIYMVKAEINSDSFDYYTIIEDADPKKTVVLGATTVFVDGEETELLLKQTVTDGKYSIDTIAAGLYKVELDENGAAKLTALATATSTKDVTVAVETFNNNTVTLREGEYLITIGGKKINATDVVVYDIAESEDGVNGDIATVYGNLKAGDTIKGYVVTETDKDGTVVTTLVVTEYTMKVEA